MDQIETPLLKLFIIFYRLIGAQLTRPQWTLPSVAQLLWNVCIALVVITGLVQQDSLRISFLMKIPCVTSISPPLFACFVNLCLSYGFPVVYVVYSILSALYGHRIVRQLDCHHFRRFYHCKRQARCIFAVILLLNRLTLLTILLERHQIYKLATWPSASNLLEYFSLYVICQYMYWLPHLFHYYQYATSRILLDLKNRLIHSPEAECEVLEQIRSLARANHCLNQLLSHLSTIYLLYTTSHSILALCLIFMCSPNVRIFINIYFIFCYMQYIAVLNGRVRQTVAEILASLQERHSAAEHNLIRHVREGDDSYRSQLSAIQSRRIQILECNMYSEYFALTVYQLGVIDVRFLVGTGLFIVGYVVFLMQTN